MAQKSLGDLGSIPEKCNLFVDSSFICKLYSEGQEDLPSIFRDIFNDLIDKGIVLSYNLTVRSEVYSFVRRLIVSRCIHDRKIQFSDRSRSFIDRHLEKTKSRKKTVTRHFIRDLFGRDPHAHHEIFVL